jgi:DNA-binding NtrC family response regulator
MGAKILLADCVSAYRNMVANQLRGLGAEVVETENGTETIAVMEKISFDVAVIDNYLLERSEVDLLPILARDHGYTKIILVVEPSFDPSAFGKFKKEKGVTNVLSGPVHPRVLMEHVEALILGKELPGEDTAVAAQEVEAANEAPPSSAKDEELKQRLDNVRRGDQEKLPGEIINLEQVLKEAKTDPENKELIKEAHRMAHTIHGTSGTLGFVEISAVTEELEDLLKRIMNDGFADDDIWETIFEALEKARTAPERPSLLEHITSPIIHSVATILTADNNEETAVKTEEMAKKNLLSIVPAKDYDEVLSRIRSTRLDGAIIDIDFDGKGNSFKVVKELQSTEGLEDLPVAIMSEDSSVDNRVAATHAGASQFLQKPLRADEVVEAVRYFHTVTTSVSSRVLIVDDDEMFGAHVKAILESEGMEGTYLNEPSAYLRSSRG